MAVCRAMKIKLWNMKPFAPANKAEHKAVKAQSSRGPDDFMRPEIDTPIYAGMSVQRKTSCACGGGCPACQAKSGDVNLSQAGDPLEIEADQIADRVMRMPATATPMIQTRQNTSADFAENASVENDVEQNIMRKEAFVSTEPPPDDLSEVGRVINAGGSPLDSASRHFFESRMDLDLAHVRIHDGIAAGQSARSLNARAYTLGNNIVFGSGEYNPHSIIGKHLLAHELAHVAQQNHAPARKIYRQPAPDPAPKDDAPALQAINVSVYLDKDCSRMTDSEYSDYALLLFVDQIFSIDRVRAAEIIKAVSMHWVGFKPNVAGKRIAGSRIGVSIKKEFYRLVLTQLYGADAPFIDTMLDALYKPEKVGSEKELKDQTKSIQLDYLKSKLSPLDWAYIKSHYNLIPGATLDKQLADIRKVLADLHKVKQDPVAWFKHLKTQLSPIDFYHQIAAEFKRMQSLFFHTIFSKALTVQADPLNVYYKTDMQQLYKEYPWLQQAESDIKTEAAKFTSAAEQNTAIQQELNINGFRDMAHYEEFAVMFVDAFRDVVAYKIEQQLNLNEEIVLKEQAHYTSGDLSVLQGLFSANAPKLKFLQEEYLKLSNRSPPYDNLTDQDVVRTYRMMDERKKEIYDDMDRTRTAYSYAYPILADKTLSNDDLLVDDSKVLQAKLLAVTRLRLGNIRKTRDNLKKSPEKFVYMVADHLYVKEAYEVLFIDLSSLEAFVIKGRIDKMQADETLKNLAFAALTIGLGLISLPFTGTAAALASIPGFVLGVYSSVEEIHDYRMRMAAAGTAFDIKDAILKEEPGLFWLILGLAGTALDGFIITKTFAKLAKSRFIKYGLPERKFLQELEDVVLKEAGHLEPDKLKTLLKEVEKKVAEAEELDAKFTKAADSLASAAAKVAKTAAKTDVALIDKLTESVYWAIRRGMKTGDDFLKEAKNLDKIDRVLIDDCFKQLHAAMPGGKGLSPSAFQDVLLQIYKNNGHEVVTIFVRNEKTGVGAFMTAMKKADGKYEFLDLAGMSPNAKEIIRDIEKGDAALRLAKDSKLKGVNLDQIRELGVPTKVLSDLPAVQDILKTVEDLQKPLTDLRRQARKLSEEIEELSKVSNANQTMVATKTQKLADLQKQLSDQGQKLLAQAENLKKEAALLTDTAQKSSLLKQAESLTKDAELLNYDIRVQDAFNRRSVLRDILETARKFGDNALYYEAHHLIPVELIQESGVLRKAIEGGFDFNGLINGINLPQFSSKFRTQNIVVEMLENGSKARIIEDKVVREVIVEAAADGKKVFKLNDQVVGELNYTRQLQQDGSFIEGGKITLNKGSDVVSETLKESPFGVHTSHPNYTSNIKARLDDIEKTLGTTFTPQQARQEVENLVGFIRSKVEQARQTPGFKIDDIFKP